MLKKKCGLSFMTRCTVLPYFASEQGFSQVQLYILFFRQSRIRFLRSCAVVSTEVPSPASERFFGSKRPSSWEGIRKSCLNSSKRSLQGFMSLGGVFSPLPLGFCGFSFGGCTAGERLLSVECQSLVWKS